VLRSNDAFAAFRLPAAGETVGMVQRGAELSEAKRVVLRGLKATALMSTLFVLHPDATVPPKVIADNLFRAVGLRPVRGAWLPAHFAFGVTLEALRRRSAMPRIPFAVAVWGAGYATSLPALRLYPSLTRDHRRRAAASLLSHLVFGAALRD
jgi:hypothetical protein